MLSEQGGLPVAGGALVAGLLYAGASLFVTGPVIGERMIGKSGWSDRCLAHIRASIEADIPAAPELPRIGCRAIFGLFGPAGAEYCRHHGHHFDDNVLTRTMDAAQKARRETQRQRVKHAASRASSRCNCAVTLTLENRRVPLALHAGSLRLITPPSVKALQSELRTALSSPHCAMKG